MSPIESISVYRTEAAKMYELGIYASIYTASAALSWNGGTDGRE